MLFAQEQKRAASEHSLVAAAMQNTVTVTRLQQNKTLLSEEDTYAVVEKVLESQKKRGAGRFPVSGRQTPVHHQCDARG